MPSIEITGEPKRVRCRELMAVNTPIVPDCDKKFNYCDGRCDEIRVYGYYNQKSNTRPLKDTSRASLEGISWSVALTASPA